MEKSFRLWWQKPKKTIDLEEERRVTFLELFYDLVYVAIVAELTHMLVADISLSGVVQFVFMFIIVWWAWINGTLYHELHGNNDIRTRVFTFLQMFSVGAMAIFAHNALGEGFVGFALSYAAFQLILTFLWWRTGVHDPLHRPLSQPYVFAFLITTGLFFASIFMQSPYNYLLWIVAVTISLVLPLTSIKIVRKNPEVREEFERTMHIRPSLVERFGLFTIIVLGEVVIGVVRGVVEHHHPDGMIFAIAALGMLLAISMWWVYFDFISHRLPKRNTRSRYTWTTLHLPLTGSIAMVGAGVLYILEHPGGILSGEVQWLLVVSVAVFLVCVYLLMKIVAIDKNHQEIYTVGGRKLVIAAGLAVLLGFLTLHTITFLVGINILVLSVVFAAVRVWIRKAQDPQSIDM